MFGDQLRCLALFYVSPRKAASAVLDHGRFLFAAVAAVLVTMAISVPASSVQSYEFNQAMQRVETYEDFPQAQQVAASRLRARYFATGFKVLLVVAVLFAPVCILILAAWDHLGGGMTILFRDYMPVVAGLLFAWTAAHLPVAAVWWSPLASPEMAVPLQLAGLGLFTVFAAQVLATVTGAVQVHAAVAAVTGLAACGMASLFLSNSGNLLYMLGSPWLLYLLYQRFSGDMQSLGGGLAERQHFKRQLELATINPRDADAHYQLGLLYVQRRLPAEAEQRFRRALEIDPNEPDALFQLGRLLRQQEVRGTEARELLERGAAIDPKLSSHEVWRELGAVALGGGQIEEALRYLGHYVKVREYDPEGLVLHGQALKAAGRPSEARVALERALEAAREAPKFRRAEFARWQSQARQELKGLDG